MARLVDAISSKKPDKLSSKTVDSTDDIWVKHYHLFKRKEKSVWSTPKNNIVTRPASPKLLKAAQKVKKTQKKSKAEIEKRQKIKRGVLLLAKTSAFLISFLILIFSVATYAYVQSFDSRAYYGVKILGEEVGGKTEPEIRKILDRKIDSLSFSFSIDGQEVVVKPEEAGVTFDSVQTAKNAVTKGKDGSWYQQWFYSAGSLLQGITPSAQAFSVSDFRSNLDFHYVINDQKLTDFTQTLSLKFNQDSQNAGLVMQGTEVQVIPAVYGRKIVTESVKAQIAAAVRSVKSEKINIDVDKVDPTIIESDTRKAIEEAKSLLNIPVTFTYKDQKYQPDKATIGGWIVFETKNEGMKDTLIPKIDPKRVYPYIYSLAGKINIPAINKKVTVKNGTESVVEQEGKEGLAVDVDKASVNTANILNSRKVVTLELPTYVVKPKTAVNNIIVADWSKYIEVNISAQRMCAYLAGGEVVNCWAVTTGQNNVINGKSTRTPTGTYLIQRKSGEGGAPGAYGGGVCMPNPPSPYPLCGINYVSTFTPQGHAIHEAWWRSSFGGSDYVWNGSHGCVNSPYDVAKFIYYWAPIGTPVIVHY